MSGQPAHDSPTTPPRLETGAITSLFPRVAAITILLLVLLISIRGSTGGKVWDKAAFAASCCAAAVLAMRFLRRPEMPPSRLALLVSVVGILCGIARVERPQLTSLYWEGFGTSVALVCVPLAFLVVPLAAGVRRSRTMTVALTVPMLLLAVVDAASLVRDVGDFASVDNNIFVINEMFAPAAGRVPGAGFVPQYTTLFGWGVVPFRHLLTTNQLVNLSTIGLSILGIASIALAAFLARRSLPERSLWLALALTVPVTTVTVLHGAIESSIGSYFQELPIRMFPAMLYSVIAVGSLVSLLQRSVPKRTLISLGVLAGLMAWNSQDFGIAVAVAFGIVLQITIRGSLRRRATMLWIAGLLPGLLFYPFWTVVIRHPLQFKYLAVTARSFGGGFGSSPIQIPGPVLLVLPVILGSVATGCALLWKAGAESKSWPMFQQRAVVTLAFVGTWSTIGFVYYLNRSYASGQLQLFLLPFGVCCCALFSLCHSAMVRGKSRTQSFFRSYLKDKVFWFLPVTLPIAVGFGAILQTPYPSRTLDALVHPPAAIGFSANVDRHEVLVAQRFIRYHGGGSLGYIGPSANYLALLTGVSPRILYDDPSDFSLSNAALQLACEYVQHDPTKWIVTPPGASGPLGTNICGDYKARAIAGEPPNTFFRLVRSGHGNHG